MSKTAATDSVLAATALLTEHLQYTPLSLIDDIINSVNEFIYQGIGSLETGLQSTPPERLGFKPQSQAQEDTSTDSAEPSYPEAKQEIEEGLHKLETLLNASVDKNFDKFEIYVLRNILSVPADLAEWVQLTHYENIKYSPTQDNVTPEIIHVLRQKLAASRMLSRALREEHSRNETILRQLRGFSAPATDTSPDINLSFLNNPTTGLEGGSTESLSTNSTFALSQLPALRSAVSDLKSRLQTISTNPITNETAKDEMREERRQYIEQRTQVYVGRHGDTAVGSALLQGTNTSQAEVEALEKAAAIFDTS